MRGRAQHSRRGRRRLDRSSHLRSNEQQRSRAGPSGRLSRAPEGPGGPPIARSALRTPARRAAPSAAWRTAPANALSLRTEPAPERRRERRPASEAYGARSGLPVRPTELSKARRRKGV